MFCVVFERVRASRSTPARWAPTPTLEVVAVPAPQIVDGQEDALEIH
jgi:hypothetical protein